MGWFAIIVLVILFVVFGPLLTIWSLNTLFGFGIAYNITTWFAALVLGGLVSARSGSTSK